MASSLFRRGRTGRLGVSAFIRQRTGSTAAVSIATGFFEAPASGPVTITCAAGDAAANGLAALINRSVVSTVGNASATGQPILLNRSITTAVGDAAATGQAALVSRSISATVGDVSATGQAVLLNRTIPTAVGDASAQGLQATITQGSSPPVTITCAVGDALSPGVAILLNTTTPIIVGDAAASGVTAGLNFARVIASSVGNASATGVRATISSGGAVYPFPYDVRSGVQYGPNGTDYTGSLAGGTSNLIFARRR